MPHQGVEEERSNKWGSDANQSATFFCILNFEFCLCSTMGHIIACNMSVKRAREKEKGRVRER